MLSVVYGNEETCIVIQMNCTKSNHYFIQFIRCYFLDTEKYDYEFKVVSLKMNVKELKKTLENAKKSPFILSIISNVVVCDNADDQMLESMPSDESINLQRQSSAVIDKSDWVTMTLLECLEKSDKDIIKMLSKVRSAVSFQKQLNSKLKRTCLVYQRKVCQYDECVDNIIAIHNALQEPIIVNHYSIDNNRIQKMDKKYIILWK